MLLKMENVIFALKMTSSKSKSVTVKMEMQKYVTVDSISIFMYSN
jgi:hypothetical protein